jgi:hypothetical protein
MRDIAPTLGEFLGFSVDTNGHSLVRQTAGFPRPESCFSATKPNRTLRCHSGIRVLHGVQSLAILLNCLYTSLMKPRQNVTIGSEHCHAGHVQT